MRAAVILIYVGSFKFRPRATRRRKVCWLNCRNDRGHITPVPEIFSFAVFERIALGIGDDPLLAQRQISTHEIRAVLGDFNLRMAMFGFHDVEKQDNLAD